MKIKEIGLRGRCMSLTRPLDPSLAVKQTRTSNQADCFHESNDVVPMNLSEFFSSEKDIFYYPQRSCSKVMFLHLSVILFTGGGGMVGVCGGEGVYVREGMHGRGMCGRRHAWCGQGRHVWCGPHMAGGGVHGGGHS